MKTIFASNSNFGEIVLRELLQQGVRPDLLVTAPDKKMGRGLKKKPLPIKNFAEKEGIIIKEANDIAAFHEVIKKEKPSMVIVAGFGLIIPKETLDITKFVNLHPSLLPKYRGSTPIQSAIMNGEKESGVSIILMDEKIDHGPILYQEKVPFHPKITYGEAEEILAKKSSHLLSHKMTFIENNEFTAIPQEEEDASYTKMITKEDRIIDWKEPAKIIERKIRALNPSPGIYTRIDGKIVKIIKSKTQKQTENGPFGTPGKIYLGTNDTIGIQTGKDFLLVEELQVEGKKPVRSKDFIQGNFDALGGICS